MARVDVVHTYPDRDLIDHDTDGGDCPCGPTTEPVERPDGSYGWHVIHHSLDGRELREKYRCLQATGDGGLYCTDDACTVHPRRR